MTKYHERKEIIKINERIDISLLKKTAKQFTDFQTFASIQIRIKSHVVQKNRSTHLEI